MAINYITLDRTKKLGNELNTVVASLREQTDRLRQLKEIMDNMTDAVDWTAIEAEFGIPVGKGNTLYNLVAGTNAEFLADTNLGQLIDWVVPAN